MFWSKERGETQLDRLIQQLELDMQMTPDADPKINKKKAGVLADLYAIRNKNVKGIDPNTVLICATNILGIVFIIAYEHGHVITSKALPFVTRALK